MQDFNRDEKGYPKLAGVADIMELTGIPESTVRWLAVKHGLGQVVGRARQGGVRAFFPEEVEWFKVHRGALK